jgi:hypothetical protein
MTCLSPWRCWFSHLLLHVRFLVDKVALGQVTLLVLQLTIADHHSTNVVYVFIAVLKMTYRHWSISTFDLILSLGFTSDLSLHWNQRKKLSCFNSGMKYILWRKFWGRYLDLREELTGQWRNLHTEELHNLYFSSNVSDNLTASPNIIWWVGGWSNQGWDGLGT